MGEVKKAVGPIKKAVEPLVKVVRKERAVWFVASVVGIAILGAYSVYVAFDVLDLIK